MPLRQPGDFRERFQLDVFRQVFFNVVAYAPQCSGRQATN